MTNPMRNSNSRREQCFAIALATAMSVSAAEPEYLTYDGYIEQASRLVDVSNFDEWLDMACLPCHGLTELSQKTGVELSKATEPDCERIDSFAGLSAAFEMPPDKFWRSLYTKKLSSLKSLQRCN